MAVALSSRPVQRVGRIWAEGNLLRGAGGDFKTDTQFRFHEGNADQPLDPLIASAESTGQCPAYRGTAYAVFEDFQLADYGNRIPSLTFEIFERDTLVPVNAIFAAASGGAVTASSGEKLSGYAMSGGDARTALSPLLNALPIMLRVNGGSIELVDWWQGADSAADITAVAAEANNVFDRPTIAQQPGYTAPHSLKLRHYDPARDFQAGVQTSQFISAARSLQQLELPAALSASAARRVADLQLLQARRAKESLLLDAALGSQAVHAGEWIKDADGRRWRVSEIEHRFGTIKVTAMSSTEFDPTVPRPASSGRNLESRDLNAGQTNIVVIDLPVFGTVDPVKPQVAVFANGTEPGWRRAALSRQHGNQLLDIGTTALPATMGHLLSALPRHNPAVLDLANTVEVQLLHDGMAIPELNGSPLAGNAALCWVDNEFVRFGSAEALGNGRYRLTNLLRGCYGSEDAVSHHMAGSRFVLMDAASARIIDDSSIVAGSTVTIEALGLGDDDPAVTTELVTAKAIAPRRPMHCRAQSLADGSIYLNWARRSRIDFGWNDGVDQALVEDAESYSVSLIVGGQTLRQWLSVTSEHMVHADELSVALLPSGTTIVFEVRQIGRHMMSAPATIHVTLPT